MKKINIYILFCVIFFNNCSFGQGSWIWQNPLPTRSGLNDILFLDSLNGYTVGINGTVLKTINGGNNWSCVNYFKTIYLNSVYFFDKNTGYILSDDHLTYPAYIYSEIIRTTNGGLNWNIVHTENSYKLNKIFFVNQNTGFALSKSYYMTGHNILKSTNSGLNWFTVNIPYVFDMTSVSFYNDSIGVIAGSNGTVIKTTNVGNNWTLIKSGNEQYNDIFFKDLNTIFVIGYDGAFRKTTNGGINWQNVFIYPLRRLNTIKFINNNTGYIAGGNIFKTINGGLTWDTISSDFNAKNIVFPKNNLFYSLGISKIGSSSYDSSGLIYKSIDSGKHWTNIHSYKVVNDLNALYMFDANNGIAVGNGGTIIKTTNGSSWDSVNVSFASTLNCVKFFNSYTGIIGGISGVLYVSTNSGSNWSSLSTGHTLNITSLSFPTSNIGFYSCWGQTQPLPMISYGRIYRTSDRGYNWVQVYSVSNAVVNKIFFVDSVNGFAVGSQSIGLLKTTNSGLNWYSINTPYAVGNLGEVHFINTQTGFAAQASDNGNSPDNIYMTTNGGNNWICVDTNSFWTGTIQFINNLTGYYAYISFPNVGRSGNIIKTTNGGYNWFSLSNSENTSLIFGTGLTSIQFLNNTTGYVVGERGLILKTTNGGGNYYIGINNESENIPSDFTLYQNYPNPFNSGTVIKFDLKKSTDVILKVYDILGKEKYSLVEAHLNMGSYQYRFDTKYLSSGIYFYRLKTEKFAETKKMLIIK